MFWRDYMNLQDLLYFHHLAESLSFTETAKHFFVSQPSISMAMQRLEKEFDTTLIDRRKNLKGLALTPAGEILYKKVKNIVLNLKEARQEMKDIELGSVYFGLLPTIGSFFLPQILPRVSKYSKALNFIEEESSDLMYELVLQERVPIALVGHAEKDLTEKSIQQYFIREDEFSLWVSKNHPLASKEEISLTELREEVFISLAEGYTHNRIFEKWTEEHAIQEPNIVYANEIKTIKSVISSTEMVGFMSSILVDEGDSQLVKISLPNAPKFYVSLVENKEMKHSFIQQQFNEKIIEISKEML